MLLTFFLEGAHAALPVRSFRVCGTPLKLEVASTEMERSIGLMFRTQVPEGTGMLFVYPTSDVLNFWMKNVPMDIDIGFFDTRGRLVHSLTMLGTKPGSPDWSYPSYSSQKPARFAVEVQKGFFESLEKKQRSNCKLDPIP
ncbi:MAG: DUF192 domain-containing protein [Oligoflexia bacterium]